MKHFEIQNFFELSEPQKSLLVLLHFSSGKSLRSVLRELIGSEETVFSQYVAGLTAKGLVHEEGNFLFLDRDVQDAALNFLTSGGGAGKNSVFDMLAAFAVKDIATMCHHALVATEDLLARRRSLEMRFFYDIAAACFIASHPDVSDPQLCRLFIDVSYRLLIYFESFPIVLNRSLLWYIKARSLGFAIGNYSPADAVPAASGFLLGSNKAEGSKLFSVGNTVSARSCNSTLASQSGSNFAMYLSIQYFLEGNFIKSINSIYNYNDAWDLNKQYYSRTAYVFACSSAIYLGEYDIAIEMLNIGIRHAEAQGRFVDISTLEAIKAYTYVFCGNYKKVEELAGKYIKECPEYVTSYAELWSVRAIVCMHWRMGHIKKSFDIYKKYLKKSVDEDILYVGCVVATMILEIMTDWEISGLGHPLNKNILKEIEDALKSSSVMLRNIALRCHIIYLAAHSSWKDKKVVQLMEECLRDARFLASPVQRAKTLLCAIRVALAHENQDEAEQYMEEVADTVSRYGCPVVPMDLEFLLEEQKKAALSGNGVPHIVNETPLGKESGFIIHSASMQELLRKVTVLAPRDTSVLLLGESGVGKEHIARQLHELSGRKGEFVAVNLASMPNELFESEFCGHEKGAFTGAGSKKIGLLELADGGTLFLDEVGDIPLVMQVKLLRLLQEKSFMRVGGTRLYHSDFRVISATNKDLEESVRNETFREDLYYRINVFSLKVPPLRERQHDVIFIAEFFLDMFLKKYSLPKFRFSSDDLRFLTSYRWPGNVRELKNYIERYVFLADSERSMARTTLLQNQMVSIKEKATGELRQKKEPKSPPAAPVGEMSSFHAFLVADRHDDGLLTIEELKNSYIEFVYKLTKGSVTGLGGMAEVLGVSKVTAYSWVEKLHLKEKYEINMIRTGK